MKDSCLDCQFYKHKETVFDGYKEECNGMIRVPKYKTIEHHCTEHPKIFKKWWEANKNKTRENVDDVPKCFALHESQRPLKKMIDLAQEILDGINNKNGAVAQEVEQ